MKILIIGSKGFIGQHLKNFLLTKKHKVWGADVVVDYVHPEQYFLIDASNADYHAVFQQTGFDICINCSGAASVPDSLQHPLRDFNLNTTNVFKLLDAIRLYQPGCKFINLSSAAVYGNPQILPVAENIVAAPVSPYGVHKLISENICAEFNRFFGIATCSLRIFSAYGEGLKKQLFWDLFQKTKSGNSIDLYGTGNESRDFIYIDDLVQAIYLIAQHGEFKGQAMNVANGTEIFIEDCVNTFYSFFDKPIQYQFMGQVRAGDPNNWVADISALQQLGYKQKHDLAAGLKKILRMDQGSRFSIGIIFNFTRGWLGGFYYYQNIIRAINFLDDDEKPQIIIFYNKDYSEYLSDITYPYLKLVPWEFISVNKGYLISILKRKNIFVDKMICDYNLEGIYSVNDNPIAARKVIQKGTIAAAWFPDLQHKFFPEFFDKKRLWLRELRLKLTLKNASDLVVSSHDTVNHFKQFYSIPSSLRIHVLQFVSVLEGYKLPAIEKLKVNYNIPDAYYIVSNSFLKHKNHLVVLRALKVMKENNQQVHVVFTGKMQVYADDIHINQLRKFIQENQLQDNVSLLGVIPREHQLSIMTNAKAVLQPSRFEGWNTTIEDAKCLQLPVIASGIAVHKEQLGDKGTYFDPENENELAQVLGNYRGVNGESLYGDHKERIKIFARTFLKIFQQVKQ